jgi:hypothetical protein
VKGVSVSLFPLATVESSMGKASGRKVKRD